jgi:hypothetical protein
MMNLFKNNKKKNGDDEIIDIVKYITFNISDNDKGKYVFGEKYVYDDCADVHILPFIFSIKNINKLVKINIQLSFFDMIGPSTHTSSNVKDNVNYDLMSMHYIDYLFYLIINMRKSLTEIQINFIDVDKYHIYGIYNLFMLYAFPHKNSIIPTKIMHSSENWHRHFLIYNVNTLYYEFRMNNMIIEKFVQFTINDEMNININLMCLENFALLFENIFSCNLVFDKYIYSMTKIISFSRFMIGNNYTEYDDDNFTEKIMMKLCTNMLFNKKYFDDIDYEQYCTNIYFAPKIKYRQNKMYNRFMNLLLINPSVSKIRIPIESIKISIFSLSIKTVTINFYGNIIKHIDFNDNLCVKYFVCYVKTYMKNDNYDEVKKYIMDALNQNRSINEEYYKYFDTQLNNVISDIKSSNNGNDMSTIISILQFSENKLNKDSHEMRVIKTIIKKNKTKKMKKLKQ